MKYKQNLSKLRACRYTGSALWSRMTNSFGYLNKLGYAGHLFPIVIGETGSFYTSAQARCLMHDSLPW